MKNKLVLILASKKRTKLIGNKLYIKTNFSQKNAIIKLKSCVIPKEINIKLYNCFFINSEFVKKIKYYKQSIK